jgi:tetratricopeptide (TPR) repeat protein
MENSVFIGREDELKQLQAIYNEASTGLGKMVLIQGNPGIGKSGLVRQFISLLEEKEQIFAAISECNDKEGLNPYSPFKDILLKLNSLAIPGSKENKAQTMNKLKKFLLEAGTKWVGLVPVVGSIAQAGIETYQTYQSTFGEKNESLVQSEDDIYRIFENEFRRLAKNTTVVIFLDDLQWADSSSLNLLFMLGKSIRENPFKILIIGTYRQFDIEAGKFKIAENGDNIKVRHPLADKLSELRNYTKQESHIKRQDKWFYEMAMQAFTEKEVGDLIRKRFPKNMFVNSFYADIYKLTDGHPLYLVEILNYLVQNGNMKKLPDGTFQVEQLNLSGLPVSVQAIINEKVERLGDELRKVLSYASVSGEEFAVPVIEKILKIDELDLLDYLEELSKKHGLLAANDPVHVKNMLFELYRFTQTLVHRYIYENLDGARRRALHRKMAEIMKNLYGDEIEKNNELKNKYSLHTQIGNGLIDGITLQLTDLKAEQGDSTSFSNQAVIDAAQSEIIAARESLEQYAAFECLDRVNKALGFLSGIKEKDRQTETLRFEAYHQRNKAQQWQGHYDDAYTTAQEMLKLSIFLNDKQYIALSNKALGNAVHFLGRYDEAIVYFNKALDIYKPAGNLEMIIDCLNDIAYTKEMQSFHEQAIEYLKESTEYCKKLASDQKTGQTLYQLAANFRKRGEHQTAAKLFNQALELVEKIGDRKQIGLIYNNIGLNLHALGEFNKAMEYIRKALEIAEQQNDRINIGNRLNNIGLNFELSGNLDGALEYYKKALEIDASINDRPKMAISMNNVGTVYASLEKFDKAYEFFNKSMEIYQSLNDLPGLSTTLSFIGQTMNQEGRVNEGIECLQKAIAYDLEIGDKINLASNLVGLGNIYYNNQQYEQAEDYYNRALEIFLPLEDSLSIALIHNNLGGIAHAREHYENSLEHYQYALQFYETTDDELNIAMMVVNMATVYDELRQYDIALENYQKAAAIYRKHKRLPELARQYQRIGINYYNKEDYDEAIAAFEQSNDIFLAEEDHYQVAFNFRDMADAYRKKGNLEDAELKYHKAIKHFSAANDDYQVAHVWLNIAWLHEDTKDRKKSIPCFQKALDIMMLLNETEKVAEINNHLGFSYNSLKDYKKAEQHYSQALHLAKQIKANWYIAKAYKGLASIFYANSNYPKSQEYLKLALEIFEQFEDKFELADTYYELGTCLLVWEQFHFHIDETLDCFNKSFDLFMDMEDYFNSAYSLYSIGSVYLEINQFKSAYNYLTKAKEYMTNYFPEFDIEFIQDKIDAAWSKIPPHFDRPGAV